MTRNTRAYDDAVEASQTTPSARSDLTPLDVRYIEGTSHGYADASIYTYLVVNHAAEEVIHEGRPARQYAENPSPAESRAKAEGIAVGWLRAHPDHEWP